MFFLPILGSYGAAGIRVLRLTMFEKVHAARVRQRKELTRSVLNPGGLESPQRALARCWCYHQQHAGRAGEDLEGKTGLEATEDEPFVFKE